MGPCCFICQSEFVKNGCSCEKIKSNSENVTQPAKIQGNANSTANNPAGSQTPPKVITSIPPATPQ